MEKKKEVSTEELCANFPREFYEYVKYTKKLGYEETPKYDLMKNIFVNFVVNKKKEKFDYIFDWTTDYDIKKRKEVINITCPPMNNIDLINEHNDNDNTDEANLGRDENHKNQTNRKDDYDKIESGCCVMQVNIIFNFFIFYSF